MLFVVPQEHRYVWGAAQHLLNIDIQYVQCPAGCQDVSFMFLTSLICHTFERVGFLVTNTWHRGIKPSLAGTSLAFWSCRLSHLPRIASTSVEQTQSNTLSAHALTLFYGGD